MTSWLFLPSLNARLTAVPRSIYMDPALKQITLMQHHQSCKANEYDWICKYAKKSWFKKKNHKPPKKTWRLKFENLRFFIDKEHIMGKKKPLHPLHRFIGCRSRHARAHESPETTASVEGDGGGRPRALKMEKKIQGIRTRNFWVQQRRWLVWNLLDVVWMMFFLVQYMSKKLRGFKVPNLP